MPKRPVHDASRIEPVADIVQCGEPARRRLRVAEDIDDNVDAAEVVESAWRDMGTARGRRDVRCYVVHAGKGVARNRAGRGH